MRGGGDASLDALAPADLGLAAFLKNFKMPVFFTFLGSDSVSEGAGESEEMDERSDESSDMMVEECCVLMDFVAGVACFDTKIQGAGRCG